MIRIKVERLPYNNELLLEPIATINITDNWLNTAPIDLRNYTVEYKVNHNKKWTTQNFFDLEGFPLIDGVQNLNTIFDMVVSDFNNSYGAHMRIAPTLKELRESMTGENGYRSLGATVVDHTDKNFLLEHIFEREYDGTHWSVMYQVSSDLIRNDFVDGKCEEPIEVVPIKKEVIEYKPKI